MKQVSGWVCLAVALATLALGCVVTRAVDLRALPRVEAVSSQAAESDPLAAFETERQQLRARQRAELSDILHDDDTDGETLLMAQRRLMALGEWERAENDLQASLRIRGFEGAVASVWEGGVNVFVRGEGLNRQQTAVILQEALRETGKTGGNVKIIPINSSKVFAH